MVYAFCGSLYAFIASLQLSFPLKQFGESYRCRASQSLQGAMHQTKKSEFCVMTNFRFKLQQRTVENGSIFVRKSIPIYSRKARKAYAFLAFPAIGKCSFSLQHSSSIVLYLSVECVLSLSPVLKPNRVFSVSEGFVIGLIALFKSLIM